MGGGGGGGGGHNGRRKQRSPTVGHRREIWHAGMSDGVAIGGHKIYWGGNRRTILLSL